MDNTVKVYVMGGRDFGSSILQTTEVLDLETMKWEKGLGKIKTNISYIWLWRTLEFQICHLV